MERARNICVTEPRPAYRLPKVPTITSFLNVRSPGTTPRLIGVQTLDANFSAARSLMNVPTKTVKKRLVRRFRKVDFATRRP